jgi:hypothetical protein
MKEQNFDYLFGFSKAMALVQQNVAKAIRAQMIMAEDNLESELSILIGCLEGVLRESIQQVEYIKAEKKVKAFLDFKLMKNDLDRLLSVFNKAHDQIDDIAKKSILLAKK